MKVEWMGGGARSDGQVPRTARHGHRVYHSCEVLTARAHGQIPLDGFLRMMEAMKIHGMKSGATQEHAMGGPSRGR